jgi:hypothetical protein
VQRTLQVHRTVGLFAQQECVALISIPILAWRRLLTSATHSGLAAHMTLSNLLSVVFLFYPFGADFAVAFLTKSG